MAKKDRRNRDYNHHSLDLPDSEFDIIDEFSSSFDAPTAETRPAHNEPQEAPLVDDLDDDDESEDDGFSLLALLALPLSLLGTLGNIACRGVSAGVTGLAFLGRGMMLPIRKIGSLLTSSQEDEEDEDFEAKTVTNSTGPSAKPKVDASQMLEEYGDDDDQERSSTRATWLLRGGILASVLVLTATGYGGYQTFKARSKTEDPTQVQNETSTATDSADPQTAEATKVAEPTKKPAIPEPEKKQVAEAPKPPAEPKKTDPAPKVALAVNPPKKEGTKDLAGTPAKSSDKSIATPPKPKEAGVPAKEATKPELKAPPKAPEKPVTATAAPAVAAVKPPAVPPKPDAKPDPKVEPKTPESKTAGSKPPEKALVAATAAVAALPKVEPPKAKEAGVPANDAAGVPAKSPEKTVAAPAPVVAAKADVKAPAETPAKAAGVPAKVEEKSPAPTPKAADPWAVAADSPTPKPDANAEKKPASTESFANPWAVTDPKPAEPKPPLPVPAPEKPLIAKSEPDKPKPQAADSAPPTPPALAAATPAAAVPAPSAAVPAATTAAAPAKPNLPSLAAAPAAPPPATPAPAPTPAAATAASTPATDALKNTPLKDDAPLKPLAKQSALPTMSQINEQAPAIPSTMTPAAPKVASSTVVEPAKKDKNVFGQVPTAPVIEKTSPMDTAMLPPVRETAKPETTPKIAHQGNVTPLPQTTPPPKKPEIAEAVPAIPSGPEASPATFSMPRQTAAVVAKDETPRSAFAPPAFAAVAPAGVPAKVEEKTSAPRIAETPPGIAADSKAAPPPAPMFAAMTAPAALKTNEPSPTIPVEAPVSSSAAPVTPVTPLLPQHRELAKTETPLGSRLQNGVQEIREQASETPRIRFASTQTGNIGAASGSTGAIRFTPRTAENTPMPMPARTNDVTDLSRLLPVGTSSAETENNSALPPLESAPPVVMAPINPGYGRSIRNSRPAEASVDTASRVVDRERRAMSFQQRMNAEIKKSPTQTEQYIVQEGDTYMSICDQAYGTSRLFRALAEHNRQKLGIDYRPQPGTAIEIPPADFLQTNYSDSFRPIRRRSATRSDSGVRTDTGFDSSNTRPSRQGIPYVVQQGDTVFSIATDKLKDTPLWREIVALNGDRIVDPRDPLPAGEEILLPMSGTARTGTVRR